MIPFILGAIGLIAYGLSEKETEQKSSKKSYSKGLPAKIKWDKKNNIYGKSVGSKFLKISKKEFDSLYNDAHDGYYYQANTQLKGGVMTYTLRSIHSKTKMAQGGGVGGEQITKVAEAIFSANEKNGKIKISTKASQTLGGLKYLIADLNSEHIASMIFEANQKNGKIKTQMGEKTYGQLLALISHSKSNRLDNYKMAKGGGVNSYANWESDVFDEISDTLNITFSDAQGIVMANEFYLTQSWGKGLDAKETASLIIQKSKMAKGGRIGQSGYAIMQDGKLRTDAYRRVEFFATKEKALFKLSHIPFYKPLSKEEKLKIIVPYTIPKMAEGGNISSEINALYKKSGFINDDYNWKSKLLEMLQDSSMEAYQIYQKLTAKQKKDVLEELFEMENDMGADGDEDIETSKENLSMFLSDSKNGKKYGNGGELDTWENILVDYGFKKSRTKLGVKFYRKNKYSASIDNRGKKVELYFDNDIELYSGYSIQGLIDELEKEFKH